MAAFGCYQSSAAIIFFSSAQSTLTVFLLLFCYGLSVLPLCYLYSMMFDNHSTAQISIMVDPHTLTHPLTHSCTFTLSYALTNTPYTHPLLNPLTHAPSHTHSHAPSCTPSHMHSCTLTHSYALSCTLSHPLARFLTHTSTPSHPHLLTHPTPLSFTNLLTPPLSSTPPSHPPPLIPNPPYPGDQLRLWLSRSHRLLRDVQHPHHKSRRQPHRALLPLLSPLSRGGGADRGDQQLLHDLGVGPESELSRLERGGYGCYMRLATCHRHTPLQHNTTQHNTP